MLTRSARGLALALVGGLLAACADRPQVHALPLAGTLSPESDQALEPSGSSSIDGVPLRTRLRLIAAGSYRSLFPGKDEQKTVPVAAFFLEEHAVTNEQFLRFVQANPGWRRSEAKLLFVDVGYLGHWQGDLTPGPDLAMQPVTRVSWFAARAYAAWIGRRLPAVEEWEYVAGASESAIYGSSEASYNQRILDWYSRPSTLTPGTVRSTFMNVHGVHDMHGLVWEWVENFNSALVTGESRGDTGLERTLFCGAGSIGSADPADYASFMRLAFRSSLKARYTGKNLGFRCASGGDRMQAGDER